INSQVQSSHGDHIDLFAPENPVLRPQGLNNRILLFDFLAAQILLLEFSLLGSNFLLQLVTLGRPLTHTLSSLVTHRPHVIPCRTGRQVKQSQEKVKRSRTGASAPARRTALTAGT